MDPELTLLPDRTDVFGSSWTHPLKETGWTSSKFGHVPPTPGVLERKDKSPPSGFLTTLVKPLTIPYDQTSLG